MISDPVLCWLSVKVASKEERTNHLRKILIALFSATRESGHADGQNNKKNFSEFT